MKNRQTLLKEAEGLYQNYVNALSEAAEAEKGLEAIDREFRLRGQKPILVRFPGCTFGRFEQREKDYVSGLRAKGFNLKLS